MLKSIGYRIRQALGLLNARDNWSGPSDGHYISDKEPTVAYLQRSFPVDVVERLSTILGTMMVEWRGLHFTTKSGDYMEEIAMRILNRGKDLIVVEGYSAVWKRTMRFRVVKDGNGYWVIHDDPLQGYRERFRPFVVDSGSEGLERDRVS